MSNCPDVSVLIPAERDDQVEAHLRQCEACRQLASLIDERADCEQIELLLAAEELGALDAARLERHLAVCDTCRELAMLDVERVDASHSRFAIGDEVGSGGMGRVFDARDRQLERPVAVKVLRWETGREDTGRFRREALVTARLQHPSIVPVYEMGALPSGEPFYAMRKIQGKTLARAIQEAESANQRLVLLPNVLAAAEAVGYAHNEGIIHRDLKPSNVMLGPFGETLVVDWGVAKILGEPEPAQFAGPYRVPDRPDELTAEGAVLGTPQYMSPEQANAEPADERSDVHALGGILYCVLAGRPPVEGKTSRDVIARVRRGESPSIDEVAPDAPRDLRAIVNKAMAQKPADRYRNAGRLAEDLRRYQTGKLVSAHDYTFGQLLRRWLRRNRALLAVASLLLAALIGTAAFSVRRIVRERDVAESARVEAQQQKQRAEREQVALLQEQGRQLLFDDRPLEAAVYLSEAYRAGADGPGLRLPLRQTLRTLDALDIELGGLGSGSLAHMPFSPDGALLVTPFEAGDVGVWRAATGELVHRLPVGMDKEVLSWSGDSKRLVIGDDPVTVWDATTGDELQTIEAHDAVWALDETGARLYGSDRDRIWVVEVKAGKTLLERPAVAANYWIGLSPDQRFLVASGVDGVIRFLDPATLKLASAIGSPDQPLRIDRGRPLAGLFDPRGRLLVSGPGEKRCSIWRPGAGKPDMIFEHRGEGELLTPDFSDDGNAVVAGATVSTVHVWATDDGRLVYTLRETGGPLFASFVYDDAETALIMVTNPLRHVTTLYEPLAGAPLARYDGWARSNHGPGRFLLHGKGRSWLVSPSGSALVSTSGVHSFAVPTRSGDRFVVAHDFDQALVWDTTTGQLVEDVRLSDPAKGGWRKAMAPDGSRLLERADDGSFVVRATHAPVSRPGEAANTAVLARLGKVEDVRLAVFSADATAIVFVHSNKLTIWDATSGRRLADAPFDAPLDWREPPAVSANADRIVLLHKDGSVTLWNRQGALIARIAPDDGRGVRVARFLARGETFLLYQQRRDKLAMQEPDNDGIAATLWSARDGRRIADLGESPVLPYFIWGETSREEDELIYAGSVWDTRTGERIASLEKKELGPGIGSFSDDGALVALPGGFGGRPGAWVFDLAKQRMVVAVGQAGGPTISAQLSPKGDLLALASVDGAITVWGVGTGTQLLRIPSREGAWYVKRSLEKGKSTGQIDLGLPVFGQGGRFLFTLGPGPVAHTWDVAGEARSPEQVYELVEHIVPLRLQDGHLVPRTSDGE